MTPRRSPVTQPDNVLTACSSGTRRGAISKGDHRGHLPSLRGLVHAKAYERQAEVAREDGKRTETSRRRHQMQFYVPRQVKK
ncbi:hypothetical protein NDU88_004241 [Pleurodeles waltl]|uniref:Uncharacterized protein n=1 Tax=Pleurodeles waltl TaxID=8319 RepID=A0AAV7UES4_PLEWA|nr:hypothetical protein NDU88_004241 [Pleurodeles waltl]